MRKWQEERDRNAWVSRVLGVSREPSNDEAEGKQEDDVTELARRRRVRIEHLAAIEANERTMMFEATRFNKI